MQRFIVAISLVLVVVGCGHTKDQVSKLDTAHELTRPSVLVGHQWPKASEKYSSIVGAFQDLMASGTQSGVVFIMAETCGACVDVEDFWKDRVSKVRLYHVDIDRVSDSEMNVLVRNGFPNVVPICAFVKNGRLFGAEAGSERCTTELWPYVK